MCGNPTWFLRFPYYYPSLGPAIPLLTHREFEEINSLLIECYGIQGFNAAVLFSLVLKENVAPLKRISRIDLSRDGRVAYDLTKSLLSCWQIIGYIVTGHAPSIHHLIERIIQSFNLNIVTIVIVRCVKHWTWRDKTHIIAVFFLFEILKTNYSSPCFCYGVLYLDYNSFFSLFLSFFCTCSPCDQTD